MANVCPADNAAPRGRALLQAWHMPADGAAWRAGLIWRDDEWHRRVEAWRALGASHVAVDTMRFGLTVPQAHIDAIRSFRAILD